MKKFTEEESAGLTGMAELQMGKNPWFNSAFLFLTTSHNGLGERPEGGSYEGGRLPYFQSAKKEARNEKKRVLFFIVISIAFPIMMFSCGGGGIGDIDLSHWTTPLPGPIPNPGTAVPGPVPQLPPTSNAWIIETVDSNGAVGNYNSIAVDSSGKVHISYSNYADIKYATNSSGSWVTETVDSEGIEGASNSIATDSLGKVHISYSGYANSDNNYLKYATNSSGSWVTETVDSEGTEGVSNSIAVDSSGKVHISYSGEGNAVLKYAVKQ